MNPFLLSGPVFLFCYFLFGSLVVYLFYKYVSAQAAELNVDISNFAKDPYKIAYLRGGKREALLVATLALQDRGLLVWDEPQLHTPRPESINAVNRPIEKAILSFYLQAAKPPLQISTSAMKLALGNYKHELGRAGLIATGDIFSQRLLPFLITLAALIAVTWIKVHIALEHGHHNIGLLLILTAVFAIISAVVFANRLTGAGRQLLTNLAALFALLKHRAKKLRLGGETNEVALVSAVFGLGVLSTSEFPLVARLRQTAGDGGSSCGSSSSSSCGSSCGGGGCGGCGG